MRLADLDASELCGGFLDQPQAGAVLDARTVDVLGWALGESKRAVAAELSIDGRLLARTRLRAPRPDLAAAFPDRKQARRAGFRTTLDLMGGSERFELEVAIVLKGGARRQLAWICGRRRWRRERSPAYAELASVVICCCGRARKDGGAWKDGGAREDGGARQDGCAPQAGRAREDGGAQQDRRFEGPKRRDLVSHLEAAIESALAQSHSHVEVLVVHGGRAEAAAIATHYRGVRCVRERQGGAAEARNAGIRSTNGDFLVFLDVEDRLPPDAIERGVSALQRHPECAAAVGGGASAAAVGAGVPAAAIGERAPAPAIYRRALFEHVRGFDPASSGTLDFAFELAVAAERLPLCGYETSLAGNHAHGRAVGEHVSGQEER